jgi:hypothetical protein
MGRLFLSQEQSSASFKPFLAGNDGILSQLVQHDLRPPPALPAFSGR